MQVGGLDAAARKEVEAALAPLRGAWPPRLPDWLAAFNGALGTTLSRIRCSMISVLRAELVCWDNPEMSGCCEVYFGW
jgi:hypothetical protein